MLTCLVLGGGRLFNQWVCNRLRRLHIPNRLSRMAKLVDTRNTYISMIRTPHVSSPYRRALTLSRINSLRLFSQNVNRQFDHTASLLEELKDQFDVLMLQEPPWRLIRRTVSSSN